MYVLRTMSLLNLNLLNNPSSLLVVLEMFQSKVRDLQDPAAVNQTVAGLQVPVILEGRLVEVTHPSHNVPHQTGQKHLVQPEIFIIKNVSRKRNICRKYFY